MTVLDDLGRFPVDGQQMGLLERVALALNSTLELNEVLRRLAVIGLEASGAAGTAVMLLEGRLLKPAVVVRTVMNDAEGTYERFFSMPPVELDLMRWSLLKLGQAVALEDARDSELVPPELVQRFDLRGIALVPLMAGDEPCGLMLVDWDEVRRFGARDMPLLEAIGTYAGIAVRNARLFDATRKRARLQEALADAAGTLASPIEPQLVAERLADAYMDLLGARLCGVALLDASRERITAVAARGCQSIEVPFPISSVPAHLSQRFFEEWTGSKHPVRIDNEPWLDELLGARAAGADWYLLLPLVVDTHVRGFLVLGFAAETSLDDEERSVAEALAGIAAAALERHELLDRLDGQLRRLDALYRASAALNSSASLDNVLELVCTSFEELVGSTHCSVNTIDETGTRLRTVAVRGVPWLAGRPDSVAAIRRDEVARLTELWTDDPVPAVYEDIDARLVTEPSVVPRGVRSAVLLPLRYNGGVPGVVVLGLHRRGNPGRTRLETAQALANLASAAVQRARLSEALRLRLGQVEALYRLSDVVAGPANLSAAVRELNRLFGDDLAATFGSVAIDNKEIREVVGARAPDAEEAAALATWRAAQRLGTSRLRPWPVTGGLLIPVATPSRVIGLLRVVADVDALHPSDEELLVAIGSGCAEVVQRASLRQELSEQERRLAVSGERERIARDLHDSVGQVLTAIGLRLAQWVEDMEDPVWRGRLGELLTLASEGSDQARQAIYSLLFLETRRDGLLPSLRELATKFQATTGIESTVRVSGTPFAIGKHKDDALFRTTHEALMNVRRHAQASTIAIAVAYGRGNVVLTVRDDGVGLPVDGLPGPADHHFGLTSICQLVENVGGVLHVRSGGASGGVVVEARLPVDRPRGASGRGRR